MSEKKIKQTLENLGEYIQEEQTEYQDTQHEFSANYRRKKEILLDSVEPKKRFHMSRPAAAVAAILVVAACSVSVYAAVKLLQTKVDFNEEEHHVSVTNEVTDNTYIPPIKITAEYLPEGYEECEVGKYSYQGELGRSGISIIGASATKTDKYEDVSNCEVKELSNAKAYIMNRKGYEYSHIVLLSFEEEGHTVVIYAIDEIPEEELLKVCENITITEVPEEDPDRTFQAYSYDPEAEEEVLEPDMTVTEDQIVGIQEPFKEECAYTEDYEEKDVQVTVMGVTVSDRVDVTLLNENTVSAFLDQSIIGEDGTFPDYKVIAEYWDNEAGELKNKEIGTYPVKYVEVTAELENLSDSDLPDVNVQPQFCNLIEGPDGTYERQYLENDKVTSFGEEFRGCNSYELSTDHFPFYFDSSTFPGDPHFYNTSLSAGEKKTVRMGFAVPEHWMDNLYLGYHMGYEGSIFVKLDAVE